MKIANNIGWCDETTNAVTGCDKVSAGCAHCYAQVGTRARVLRHRKVNPIETWGPNGVRHSVNFEPVFRRLNRYCVCGRCHTAFPVEALTDDHGCIAKGECHACDGPLRRVRLFADSNSDWLDDKWPIETLARFLDAIRQAPNVNVLLLTKRIEGFQRRLQELLAWAVNDPVYFKIDFVGWIQAWLCNDPAPKNLWLGVSVENQAMADKRIPLLLKTPAAIRFLSVEPLLSRVDLTSVGPNSATKHEYQNRAPYCNGEFVCNPLAGSFPFYRESDGEPCVVDWVIVGGESGPEGKRRDCGVDAITEVAAQCEDAGVPVYVKQDCAFKDGQQGRIPDGVWGLKQFPRISP